MFEFVVIEKILLWLNLLETLSKDKGFPNLFLLKFQVSIELEETYKCPLEPLNPSLELEGLELEAFDINPYLERSLRRVDISEIYWTTIKISLHLSSLHYLHLLFYYLINRNSFLKSFNNQTHLIFSVFP